MVMRSFVTSAGALPRRNMGLAASHSASVHGAASGSARAAAVMTASSSDAGNSTNRPELVFSNIASFDCDV